MLRWKGENVSTAEVEVTVSKVLDGVGVVAYGVKVNNNIIKPTSLFLDAGGTSLLTNSFHNPILPHALPLRRGVPSHMIPKNVSTLRDFPLLQMSDFNCLLRGIPASGCAALDFFNFE